MPEKETKFCTDCLYEPIPSSEEPCITCLVTSTVGTGFKPKERKVAAAPALGESYGLNMQPKASMMPSDQLAAMIALASEAHKEQFDKAGRPYILHCLKVMHYLPQDADDELRCIAVGHDLLEDTAITGAFLFSAGFSVRVIDGILRLTRIANRPYEAYKALVKSSRDSILVKMADLRHNSDIRRIKEPGPKDFERIARYRAFYTELEQELKSHG